jgi:hypothetical protein
MGWLFVYAFTKFILTGISSSVDVTFERSPRSLFLYTTPLLEENGTLALTHGSEYP